MISQQKHQHKNSVPVWGLKSPISTWIQKSGVAISIVEMKDPHLVNALRMYLRYAVQLRDHTALEMMCYAEQAPDGAADCALNEANALMEDDPEAMLLRDKRLLPGLALLIECCRRGLVNYRHADPSVRFQRDEPINPVAILAWEELDFLTEKEVEENLQREIDRLWEKE